MYKDLDRQLIQAFQREGRISLRRLAQQLGVATTTVSKRLQELEQSGVIQGFKPIVDYSKLGYHLTVIIQIKAAGKRIAQIAEELKRNGHLTHVYELTGEFDILAIGKFRDSTSMNRELKQLLSLDGIEDTNTSLVLGTPKEHGERELL